MDQNPEPLPPGFENADEQAHFWCAALKKKKAAMEELLKAQRSLEKIEVAIAQHLFPGTIEDTHTRFLSALDPSNAEASYLLTIGSAVVEPFSSRMNTICVSASSNSSRSNKPTRGGTSHIRRSRAVATRG